LQCTVMHMHWPDERCRTVHAACCETLLRHRFCA
jgi:hypothetical protein